MKSLRFKILLFFLIPITMTFIIMLFAMHTQIKGVNRGLTEELSREIINAKAEKIGTWIYQRVSELKVLSENTLIMEMDIEKLKPYMEKFEKMHLDEFESFGISDLSGNKWVSHDGFIDVSKRSYFEQMLKDNRKYTISNPIVSLYNAVPIVVVTHEVRNEKGERVGFIDGAIRLSKLQEIASEVKMKDGIGWLIDGSGNIFTDVKKRSELINIKTLEQWGYKNIPKAIEAMGSGKEGIISLVNNVDKTSYLIHAPIPYTNNWSLGIITSEELIFQETNQLLIIIILLGIFVLLCVIIMAIVFSNYIVKPIRSLQEIMKRTENGQLNIRYEAGNRKDEIAQLGLSYNNMIEKIQILMDRNEEEQTAKRKAELRALQAQIKPHFLYNTLDTIKWMALEYGAKDIAQMTKSLTKLFQISLSKGREVITIEDEITHIKQYLYIQKVRYEDKLNYSIECEESLKKEVIIKLILQPIVENAIYHGIKPKIGTGNIWIRCEREKNNMVLCVINDGVDFEEKRLCELRKSLKSIDKIDKYKDGNKNGTSGYGLLNIQERIRLLYVDKYGIEIFPRQEGGTKVKVTLPIIPLTSMKGEQNVENSNS